MNEDPVFTGLRKRLVEHIKKKGISDKRVLQAMLVVPRHKFVDVALRQASYEDRALPLILGQTISQPYTVALQTSLLKVNEGDKILEIGTGSGYQAAILSQMKANVYSIERHKKLYAITKNKLLELGYFVHLFYGDGYEGLPAYAPFDKIIITAAAPYIPKTLKKQLKIGGILVAPVGEGDTQTMVRLSKITENEFKKEHFGYFTFVPMVKGKALD